MKDTKIVANLRKEFIYKEKEEIIGYIREEITLEFIENLQITSNFIKEGTICITDGVGNILSAGIANEVNSLLSDIEITIKHQKERLQILKEKS